VTENSRVPRLRDDELPLVFAVPKSRERVCDLAADLARFEDFGHATRQLATEAKTFAGETLRVPTFVNEFWTAKQRQASSLHEISYRACFKPQLPRFFIERLTDPGSIVYDSFMGRGTTLVEAALLGRAPAGCDVNPLSITLTRPRLNPPFQRDVETRLEEIDFSGHREFPEELLVFYHPETLREICALKRYLSERRETAAWDAVDDWIALVALNRLTGHSPGFFSVYTMPPNQAVSAKSQQKNAAPARRVPHHS